MNIVHCIFTMKTGGAQMLVVDIINRLPPEHNVSLVLVNDEVNESVMSKLSDQVTVYKIGRPEGSKNPVYLLKLNLLLLRLSPDVIHCHEVNMVNFIFRPLFKTLLTVHNVGFEKIEESKYSQLIAISSIVAKDVLKRFNQTIPVVNNGIHFNDFYRKSSYDSKDTVRLIQVSRLLHGAKGQDVLIESLRTVINKFPNKRISLTFVGEGPSLSFLENLVAEKNLTSNIEFIGNRDRQWIMENLCNYDILLQPSRYEGFGLTVIEGVAAGLPVVASHIDGPAEIFEEIDQKFLFETENSSDCSLKISEVIAMYEDNQITDYMGKVRKLISKRYSIDSTVNGYLKVYTELTKQR